MARRAQHDRLLLVMRLERRTGRWWPATRRACCRSCCRCRHILSGLGCTAPGAVLCLGNASRAATDRHRHERRVRPDRAPPVDEAAVDRGGNRRRVALLVQPATPLQLGHHRGRKEPVRHERPDHLLQPGPLQRDERPGECTLRPLKNAVEIRHPCQCAGKGEGPVAGALENAVERRREAPGTLPRRGGYLPRRSCPRISPFG